MSDREPLAEAEQRTPWGFVIVVALAAVYVVLRLVQMAGWLIDWLR